MISNVSDQVSVNEVIKPSVAELFTDHGIVSFQFITTLKSPPKIKRLVYYFSKGDFDRLRSVVRAVNLLSIISSDCCEINDDWQRWKDTLLAAVVDFVLRKKLKGRKLIPWINGLIINLNHKKISIRKKTQTKSHRLPAREIFITPLRNQAQTSRK